MKTHRAGTTQEPLRIVIVGSSVAYMVAADSTSKTGRNYGQHLQEQLLSAGVVADVRFSVQWFGMIDDCRRDLERTVRNHFPDILVVHYGTNECQPQILPNALYSHIAGWNRSGATVPNLWHDKVIPRAWPLLRKLQQLGAAWTGQLTWRMRPVRFARELSTIVSSARNECGALVLVVDLDEPGDRLQHFMPGMSDRRSRYQRAIAKTVENLSSQFGRVELIAASADVPSNLIEDLVPDGLHRTDAGHALIAARLTAAVLADR